MVVADHFTDMDQFIIKSVCLHWDLWCSRWPEQLFRLFGILPKQLLFTDFSFLIVAVYIQLPFMIIPLFNALEELPPSFIAASKDLGASSTQTFFKSDLSLIFKWGQKWDPSSLYSIPFALYVDPFDRGQSCDHTGDGDRRALHGNAKLGQRGNDRGRFDHCNGDRDALYR